MSRFKTTRIKMMFRKTPLIVLAALPLTVGAVANPSAVEGGS